MFTSQTLLIVVGLRLLLVGPSIGRGAGPEDKDVGGLKREVAECERTVIRAERELAEARARLAVAEGKRDQAAAELRKAVASSEAEARWVREHAGWFCDPRELLTGVELGLATDRAWLAEVEGNTAALVAECKKLANIHEQRLESMRRMERANAVLPADVDAAQGGFDKAQERLDAAEKRLSAERENKPGKPK